MAKRNILAKFTLCDLSNLVGRMAFQNEGFISPSNTLKTGNNVLI